MSQKQWEEWIAKNKVNLYHVDGYEERFVREVLCRIPEISPSQVTSQYPFKDQSNKKRYLDFMISDPARGICIAIELDGLTKFSSQEELADFLNRQNALLEKLNCLLLRFSNKYRFNNTNSVISEISSELKKQEYKFQIKKLKEQEIEIAKLSEKQRAEELKKTQATIDSLLLKIDSLERKIEDLSKKTSEPSSEDSSIPSSEEKIPSQSKEKAEVSKKSEPTVSVPTNGEVVIPKKQRGFSNRFALIAGIFLLIVGPLLFFGNFQDKKETQPSKETVEITLAKQNSPKATEAKQNAPTPLAEQSTPKVSQSKIPETTPAEQSIPKISQVKENIPAITRSDIIPTTDSSNIVSYIGQEVRFCGVLEEIRPTSKGRTYLNFDDKYPNNKVTVVIYDDDAHNFPDVTLYQGKIACVQGIATQLKNQKVQIKLEEKWKWNP